jgi:hypothetical protein
MPCTVKWVRSCGVGSYLAPGLDRSIPRGALVKRQSRESVILRSRKLPAAEIVRCCLHTSRRRHYERLRANCVFPLTHACFPPPPNVWTCVSFIHVARSDPARQSCFVQVPVRMCVTLRHSCAVSVSSSHGKSMRLILCLEEGGRLEPRANRG